MVHSSTRVPARAILLAFAMALALGGCGGARPAPTVAPGAQAARGERKDDANEASALEADADKAVDSEAWWLAAERATKALRLREAATAKDAVDLAPSLVALGRALVGQHAYAKAEAQLARAKDIVAKHRGPAHGDLGVILEALGDAAAGRGDYAAAQKDKEESLVVRERAFGPSSAQVGRALTSLASTRHDRGATREALALSERAVAVLEKQDDAAALADALDELGEIDKDADRLPAAFVAFQRASTVLVQKKLADTPRHARILEHWADLMNGMGGLAQARNLATQLLAISERVYAPDAPQMGSVWGTVARIDLAEGDVDAAERHGLRALEIAQDTVGVDHLEAASALLDLADVYVRRRRLALAIAIDKKVLAIRERVLGAEHPAVATAATNLASVYWEAHKYNRAKHLYDRALAIYERDGGAESLNAATVLQNIATVYYMQKKYDRALVLLERAVGICERLAPKSMKTGVASYNLGMVYLSRGDFQKTRVLLEKTLSIYETASSEKHPDFVKLLDVMAVVYTRVGDTASAEQARDRASRARSATTATDPDD